MCRIGLMSTLHFIVLFFSSSSLCSKEKQIMSRENEWCFPFKVLENDRLKLMPFEVSAPAHHKIIRKLANVP